MKLDQTITLQPNKTTDHDGKVISPHPVTTDRLNVVYVDNPSNRTYYVNIQHIPSPVVLFTDGDYERAGDITKTMARNRLLEMSERYGAGLEAFLQSFIPRTLEDDPYGPGTILAGMFSMLGIKAGKNCSCKRHALEMNVKGLEWCENNRKTILGWLEQESKNRKIPFVETLANMVLTRAFNKSRKYQQQNNG